FILVLSAVTLGPPANRAAAADRISITRDEATPDFPNGIDFGLDASAGRTIKRIELLYQAADYETLNLEGPDFQRGKTVTLTHKVDFRINFEPSGIDITYHWRITDDQGTVTETDPKTVLWSDTRFDWQAYDSADVTVYAYNRNPTFDKFILDKAQTNVDKLKVRYGVEKITPIRIWVYDSRKDFNGTEQGNSVEWAVATTYPEYNVIQAALPETGKLEVGRIIPHEVSHAILYQATKNPFNFVPTWLDEGLAVYNQETGNEDFPTIVENAAQKGKLLSIRGLNGVYPDDPGLAYAEYYSIVKFIFDGYGEEKLKTVIAAFRDGVT